MLKNKATILVSGSLVYDRIMDFPGRFADHIMPEKIHILNVSFAVNGMKESFGGTAGNIAYNLALLGEKPTVLSTVGHDFAPYKKWLLKNKIDVSRVKLVKNKSTASCYITTDKTDNQITAFNPGAMGEISRDAINRVSTEVNNSLAIISPGNIKDMENYARFYKKVGIKYIFDPGQAITALKPNVLRASIKGAEALIGNDYEIGLVMKKTGWTINEIIDKVGMLIITKGDKGSLIYSNNKKLSVRVAKPKKVIDPTGAGDAYRAGFIKGLVLSWDAKKCGQLASVVASFAVEKYGTQEHRFSWEDVKKRYSKSYGKKMKK